MAGFVFVGDDGFIGSRGGGSPSGPSPTQKTLNGIARAGVVGRSGFELVVAVGDDGAVVRRSGDSWALADSGTTRHLNAISFARGTRTAWAVGDEGTILKTTDGGRSWGLQVSGTKKHLHAVLAVDEIHVWAVGDDMNVISTGDGGATNWHLVHWSPDPERQDLRGICYHPSKVPLAVGDDGQIYRRVPEVGWREASFTGKNLRAVAVTRGGVIVAVGDDGMIAVRKADPFTADSETLNSWSRKDGLTSKHLRGVALHADGHWMVVGDDGEVLTSADGGGTWHRGQAGSKNLNAIC